MGVVQSYAIWNNKGGVGKSTIAFHVASRYAEQNPETKVLVIDMCPQANSSMMLLGGGTTGEDRLIEFCGHATPPTVVGYLSRVLQAGSGAPLPDPQTFLTSVNAFNPKMPENLSLLCGDGNLEPMSPLISYAASAPALTPGADPWKWVHLILNGFIKDLAARSEGDDWIVFIDTNPSFGIYTEIAISAATRLIVPVNADDSSRVAITAMFTLLHGAATPHVVYDSYTYATKARHAGLVIPQVHLIIGNRLTQYAGTATAFEAMSDATANGLYAAFNANPVRFSAPAKPVTTVKQFQRAFSVPLRDFNTAGVVAAHLGCPLSKLEPGYHKIHDSDVQVNGVRVEECETALDSVLKRL